MNAEDSPYILYYVLAAVLVASSLTVRKIPMGTALKMALGWIGIFAVFFTLFAFRSEFAWLGNRLKAEAFGMPIQDGETLRIPIAEDGHFYVEALVNDHPIRLMVDSGASVTTVSRAAAEEAGVSIGSIRTMVNTANGRTLVTRASADRFEIGSIRRRNVSIDVSEQDDVSLLGMNFLSSLSGWRVEGNYLVLQP